MRMHVFDKLALIGFVGVGFDAVGERRRNLNI
jgi:hypothetical protein